jgi:hypothetical protein
MVHKQESAAKFSSKWMFQLKTLSGMCPQCSSHLDFGLEPTSYLCWQFWKGDLVAGAKVISIFLLNKI